MSFSSMFYGLKEIQTVLPSSSYSMIFLPEVEIKGFNKIEVNLNESIGMQNVFVATVLYRSV